MRSPNTTRAFPLVALLTRVRSYDPLTYHPSPPHTPGVPEVGDGYSPEPDRNERAQEGRVREEDDGRDAVRLRRHVATGLGTPQSLRSVSPTPPFHDSCVVISCHVMSLHWSIAWSAGADRSWEGAG